ncbi:MAG: metal ABC transporter substrate-binding protein [Actinomycetota bacterium]
MPRLFSTLCALAVIMAACTDRPPQTNDNLRIVSSVAPITSLVSDVAGQAANISGLVPEGINSHTFEPKPSASRLLREADIIFVNGLHLEEPILKLARKNLKKGARIVELGDAAISRKEWIFDFSFPLAKGDPNPHLWTNPVYATRYIEIIRDELSLADPSHSKDFRKNHLRIAGKIDELDKATRASTKTVSPNKRKLLTYHDSFPYFAREYGWQVIGAIQPSDFSEPTASEITRLIDQIRAENIPAIFGSEVFPSKVLEQIAKHSGARYIDDLRDDDLPGNTGDPQHNYIGLMKFNLITMITAMGGDASALESIQP